MAWTPSPYAVLVFVSAAVVAVGGVVALRERPDPMALPLATLLFAIAAWALPHAVSLGYADPVRVAFWHRLRYPGTVTAPVAYLVVALTYAGHDRWLSRRVYAGLAVVPVITVVTVWTNPVHGLFWQSLSVASVGGASVFTPEYGPWYWVDLAYLYLVTVAGLFVFAGVVVRASPLYRKQAVLMFVGGLVPLATNVAVVAGPAPDPMVDLTTAALTVTGLTFLLALYRLDLIDVRPVARQRLIEELDDGVVVVGPDGRIRDYNPTAAQVLDGVDVDQPAEEVLPANTVPDGGELTAEVDGDERMFRARSTTITDDRGRVTSRIVYLNDVTDLVERDQRISVLNRVLRHNVRNELTVVSGRLELLETHLSEDQREHVDRAMESVRAVLDLSERARDVERTLRESDATVTVPAAAVAERVVADARDAYDGVVEYDPPADGGDAPVGVVDAGLFESALAELVENGVVHADRDPPRVTVSVDRDGDEVRVEVADNGPGIPETETEALDVRRETGLEHASGLGLWLVKWTASLSSGTLSFEDNDPRGTVVVLALPAADGQSDPDSASDD